MQEIVFFNIGWMDRYQGLEGDSIEGGGEFVGSTGYGHEILNFKPWQGTMYGFVETTKGGNLSITRIGASPYANKVSNVLVIWVARNRDLGGTYIVGWYKNATVHKEFQTPTWAYNRLIPETIAPGITRDDGDEGRYFFYIASAAKEDCTLLPPSGRNFRIPRGHPGEMGRSNIWYAGDDSMRKYRKEVMKYIEEYDEYNLQIEMKYGPCGEGSAHKQLKNWCAKHPDELGLQGVITVPGIVEYPFISGDRADVVFEMLNDEYAVVEIETTTPLPGAHQAIKYKALMCSEKHIPITSGNIKAILVAWSIPKEVRSFCDFYNIQCYEKRLSKT